MFLKMPRLSGLRSKGFVGTSLPYQSVTQPIPGLSIPLLSQFDFLTMACRPKLRQEALCQPVVLTFISASS
jgi:hypothetical protein